MLMINASLLNFSNSGIDIISLEGLFPSYITATMNQFQNLMSDLNSFTSMPIGTRILL